MTTKKKAKTTKKVSPPKFTEEVRFSVPAYHPDDPNLDPEDIPSNSDEMQWRIEKDRDESYLAKVTAPCGEDVYLNEGEWNRLKEAIDKFFLLNKKS